MIIRTLSQFIITMICLSSSYLKAQEELPEILETDITCECITTFTLKNNAIFYIKIGSEYYQAPLKSESLSRKIPVRGAKIFKLYDKVESEEGEVTYEPISETTLSGSGKKYLMIIRRLKGVYSAESLNLSSSSLSANKVHVLNETNSKLGFKFDEFSTVIKPQQKISHSYKPGHLAYASASIYAEYKGKPKSMGFKRLRLTSGKRFILVCFPSEARRKMGVTPVRMINYQDKPS